MEWQVSQDNWRFIMANVAAPEISTDFDPSALHTFVPEVKPGKYDGHIRAMLEADAKLEADKPEEYAKGARTAVYVVFPGPNRETRTRKGPNGEEQEYEEVVGEEAKYKRFFQDSAKVHDRTARVVSTQDQGDGLIRYEFQLGTKQNRTRKPKEGAEDSES